MSVSLSTASPAYGAEGPADSRRADQPEKVAAAAGSGSAGSQQDEAQLNQLLMKYNAGLRQASSDDAALDTLRGQITAMANDLGQAVDLSSNRAVSFGSAGTAASTTTTTTNTLDVSV
jgi:hypothetical protein